MIYKMCNDKYQTKRDEVKKLKSILLKQYGAYIENDNDNLSEIVKETKHWLEDYPKSKILYERALLNNDDRNMIDDLRLSLELLCKSILNNDKSLENNKIKLLKLLS